MTAPLVVLIAAFSLYSLPSRLRCIHLGLVVIGASLIVQAFIRGECTEAALD